MGYKIDKPKIDPHDPFKYDLLNLKPHADSLKGLLETIEEPFVIGLNGVWGSGKTTYLEMLQPYLELENFKVVYFSAWANDWAEDPLIAVFSEYTSFLDTVQTPGEVLSAKMARFKESAKSALPGLVKGGVNAAIKVATGGGLDVSALMNDFVDKSISGYQDGKKSLNQMQHALNQIQGVLKSNLNIQKPLIFIIDELDRCNPKYAVNLLERVKHIFNIQSIVFLLAYDKKQLSTSIKHFYGQETDTDNYLRRMIDLEMKLPETKVLNYFENVFFSENFLPSIQVPLRGNDYFTEYVKSHSSIINTFFSPSLRTQNHALTLLKYFLTIAKQKEEFIPVYFLTILRLTNEDMFRKLIEIHQNVFEFEKFFSPITMGNNLNILYNLTNQDNDIICRHKIDVLAGMAAWMLHHHKLMPDFYTNYLKGLQNTNPLVVEFSKRISSIYGNLDSPISYSKSIEKIVKILEHLSVN